MSRGPTTYEALREVAVDELRRSGFDLPGMPTAPAGSILAPGGVVGDWPEELDTVHSQELGRGLGTLAAWLAYAKALQGVNDSVRVRAEARIAEARAMVIASSQRDKVTDRRAEADVDPDVVALRAVEAQAHATAKLLEGRVEGLAAQYQAASREISRRLGESESGVPRRGQGRSR